jgi:hypothetical protein
VSQVLLKCVNLSLKIFKFGDSVVVRGKVFMDSERDKTIIKKLVLENGGWNVLFSFLQLYPDCLGRYG